ncbi:MAG: 50S ribosomal protein L17 [Candidatus Adiutrix sp.]|jgi:large subunit ribosomal protein L17|nr:50S ribosomal protein L17 [Candidatus Adiutrix sp.]
MRHRKANVKLGRTASHRDAMLRNMVTSLFEYDRITTTISKAKALRPLADRLVGLAKKGKADLHSFRQAAAVITKRSVLDKIFDEAAGRFEGRVSGYAVMVKLGLRKGDAAPMVILELIKPGYEKAKVGGGASSRKAKGGAGDRSRRVAASLSKKEAAPKETAAAPAEDAPAADAAAAHSDANSDDSDKGGEAGQ